MAGRPAVSQRLRLPAYVRATRRAGGDTAYYWELPPWARPLADASGKLKPAMRHGRPCLLASEALGTDLAAAIAKADLLNAALTEWRTGQGGSTSGQVQGSVGWLFAWYRAQDRYTTKKAKTRADYLKLMNLLEGLSTRNGAELGKRPAARVDAAAADKLYKRLREERGERQASYAMQVCRLVWTWGLRHAKVTGLKENPFAGMGLRSTADGGNRPTSRAEYDRYRAAARALGFQSMATAAALCFETCQRVWDVFGFEDPDGVEHRGIEWEGYRSGVEIALRQSKTGNLVVLPLTVEAPGDDGVIEQVPLYPDLEEELARWWWPDSAGIIVVEERTGMKYRERRVSTVHRAICEKAGLPKEMTFTGFRHGGITEIGDAGEADPRAVSGHKTLAVTGIYNKASSEKARRIAVARRAHIEAIDALSEARKGAAS